MLVDAGWVLVQRCCYSKTAELASVAETRIATAEIHADEEAAADWPGELQSVREAVHFPVYSVDYFAVRLRFGSFPWCFGALVQSSCHSPLAPRILAIRLQVRPPQSPERANGA